MSSSPIGGSDSKYELKDLKKGPTEIKSTEQDNEVEYFETLKNNNGSQDDYSYSDNQPVSRFRKFIDSFKRAEDPVHEVHNTTGSDIDVELGSNEGDADMIVDAMAKKTDGEDSNDETDKKLKKTIKPRHVIMISLGTGIGTGLLVGNGATLSGGGPASLVIGYSIMGLMADIV